jgi:hypothetical protein
MHPPHLSEPLDLDTLNLLRLVMRLAAFALAIVAGTAFNWLAGEGRDF